MPIHLYSITNNSVKYRLPLAAIDLSISSCSELSVENDLPCPNCGEPLDSVPSDSEFACLHCGELLALSTDNKVVLARPIQTYLELDEESPADIEGATANETTSPPQISERRRRKAAEIAYERIANEKKDISRGFFYGFFFLVFGAVFLTISLSRLILVSNDWLNLVGFGVGLVFTALGGYLALWFHKLSRSLSIEEKTINEEMLHSS